MNCLVIGSGCIGSRHKRLLQELGCEVTVVSSRSSDEVFAYDDLETIIAESRPEYTVIANSTVDHYDALLRVVKADPRGVVLVEKPIFDVEQAIPDSKGLKIFVGYNLRFHPVVKRFRQLLAGEKVLSAQAYVGQYLPDWRPGSDYQRGYSAKKQAGGGALRDLSHELDYIVWTLGRWERVAAIGGKYSHLQIDSDDVFSLILVARRCPVVCVQMNYLDRKSRREVIVNTDEHTISMDLVNGTLTVDHDTEYFAVPRDETFLAQHRAALGGDFDSLCSATEGLEIVRLITAAESAAAKSVWVHNE